MKCSDCTTLTNAHFELIAKFVDACGIPHRVLLFNSLQFRGSSLVFNHLTLNPCTHRLTVDFVITFSTPYITYILAQISLPETFFSIKNLGHSCRCHCHCYFSRHRAIFNRLPQNFTCALGILSVTCACSLGATVLPHVKIGWVMQYF